VPPKLRMEMATPGPDLAPPVEHISRGAAETEMRRRSMAQAWPGGGRPVTNGILRRIEMPRIHPLADGACATAFGPGAAAAAKGRTLKVSLAAGFRIPNWTMKPVAFAPEALSGIVWPGPQRIGHTAFANPAGLDTKVLEQGLSAPEMRIPVAPPPDFGGVFHWPGVLQVALHSVNSEVPHRAAFVPFTTSEEYPGKERPYEYRN
jgi:hypothetical protein